MKKNTAALVLILGALFFSTHLSAQNKPLSFGIKAGTNLSNYRLGGDMERFKRKTKRNLRHNL